MRAAKTPAAPRKTYWTNVQYAYLRAHYPDTPMAELMAALGRSASSIQSQAKVLGVQRSAAFIAGEHGGRMRPGDPRGQATHFKRKAVAA